mmetsp:Transcript_147157/g.257026  ORF Transcript_147157/g.257026 Transcript_147157/m.257026 type:complete len:265 (+) Transcript_147157:251-1045(+)
MQLPCGFGQLSLLRLDRFREGRLKRLVLLALLVAGPCLGHLLQHVRILVLRLGPSQLRNLRKPCGHLLLKHRLGTLQVRDEALTLVQLPFQLVQLHLQLADQGVPLLQLLHCALGLLLEHRALPHLRLQLTLSLGDGVPERQQLTGRLLVPVVRQVRQAGLPLPLLLLQLLDRGLQPLYLACKCHPFEFGHVPGLLDHRHFALQLLYLPPPLYLHRLQRQCMHLRQLPLQIPQTLLGILIPLLGRLEGVLTAGADVGHPHSRII